jgi:hypothetical protein
MQVSALNLIIAAQQARAPSPPAASAQAPQASAARPTNALANAFTPQAFPSAGTGEPPQAGAPPASGPAAPGSRIDIRV